MMDPCWGEDLKRRSDRDGRDRSSQILPPLPIEKAKAHSKNESSSGLLPLGCPKGRLKRILKNYSADYNPVDLVHPQQSFLPKCVRLLMDFVAENLHEVF